MTVVRLSESKAPAVTRLDELYSPDSLAFQESRYKKVSEIFTEKFGRIPEFFVRSPGRVNLIGEHIDYSLYSVLPMAVDRDIMMAVATRDEDEPRVVLVNSSSKFPERSFSFKKGIITEIDSTLHEWSNYFKCGYKGILEELQLESPKSLFIVIDGTVPSGAGMSSSSAFVCCSALATLTANGHTMSKGQLTRVAIRSERYCGVQSGGMDQSISVMAPSGSPLIIHFYPELSAELIRFSNTERTPVFVIANTLVTADKHVTAPTNYNLRVVETRLAAALLAKKLGLRQLHSKELLTLREVHELFVASLPGEPASMVECLLQMLEMVAKAFKHSGYTRSEIAYELGMTVQELESCFVGSITIQADVFELYKRATHVFSEARRVFQFKDTCENPSPGNLLKDLGSLINESQTSCRDLFNCSCPEIDRMTSLALSFGAFGSRLTGAGWGGCTVSLLSPELVESFIENMKQDYYFKSFPELKYRPEVLNDYIFASTPACGCGVYLSGDI